MLLGKSIARATRGHFLVQSALHRILVFQACILKGIDFGWIPEYSEAAMLACASINLAIQNLTHASYNTRDQHREASESPKARDAKD